MFAVKASGLFQPVCTGMHSLSEVSADQISGGCRYMYVIRYQEEDLILEAAATNNSYDISYLFLFIFNIIIL